MPVIRRVGYRPSLSSENKSLTASGAAVAVEGNNLPPPEVKVSSESVHVGVVEAGATARVAMQPSPIVVSGPGVSQCDPQELRMKVSTVSREQRGKKSVSGKDGLGERRKLAQLSVSPENKDGLGISLSSGSPGLGELTGWAVLEQWVAEDGGASGKEATAVQNAKPVTCQVKTSPESKGLNADAASFVPGVSYSTRSNAELKVTQLLSPGVQEVVSANGAQVKMKSVCQGMAGEVYSQGGPGSVCGSRPVVNWCVKKPGEGQFEEALEVPGCWVTDFRQIRVRRSAALG